MGRLVVGDRINDFSIYRVSLVKKEGKRGMGITCNVAHLKVLFYGQTTLVTNHFVFFFFFFFGFFGVC